MVSNLLDNAVRHATPGTLVSVRCEEKENRAQILIENAGQPIPTEELPMIWDRYHRAPRSGEAGGLGTGLGLAIVKSILEQHGVAYGVESDEVRTVFWFETVGID